MQHRSVRGRRLLAAAVAGALLSGSVAGCGVLPPSGGQTEEQTVDYGDVSSAVVAGVPRVVAVDGLERSRNGFGHRLSIGVVTDSPAPFTSDELDALVEAVWRALPWEPNTIKVVAGTSAAEGEEPVDLRAAAAELSPLGVTNAGQGGVSLTDMDVRYGAWTGPE